MRYLCHYNKVTYNFWPVILLGVCLLCCKKPDDRPNLIFFIADDMYPEMFNCLHQGNGKNLTPNLDRLAAEGVLMLNQYVTSPVCSPSRYSCLTGKYASRATNTSFINFTQRNEGQTVIQWNTHLTEQDKSLSHYLQEAGYATGMVGKNHVIEAQGLHQFTNYNADPRLPEVKSKVEENYIKSEAAVLGSGFDYAGAIYHNNPNFIGLAELAVHNLDWITAAGVEFIDQHQSHPFFLYFATTVPHGPYTDDRSWNANPHITAQGILEEAPNVLPARQSIPERLAAAGLEGQGKENLLWLDDALGALLDQLEALQIMDNTYIFFFNDHGQHAKGTLYQGGALSPSIIWKKGGFPGSKTRTTSVANIDFAPTILDLAGVGYQPDAFDGKSFSSLLFSETEKLDTLCSLYFELGFARAVIKGDHKYYALRYPKEAQQWDTLERSRVLEDYNEGRLFRNRHIVNSNPMEPFSHLTLIPGGMEAEHESYGTRPGYFDRDQLYNLRSDPEEMKNLLDDPASQAILSDLRSELQSYLDRLPGNFKL